MITKITTNHGKQRIYWREVDWGSADRPKANSERKVTGPDDLSIQMGQKRVQIALMGCGICRSTKSVMVYKYAEEEYHVECHGCDQHVGLPVVAMPLYEAVAVWNMDQSRMIRLMNELPENVLVIR